MPGIVINIKKCFLKFPKNKNSAELAAEVPSPGPWEPQRQLGHLRGIVSCHGYGYLNMTLRQQHEARALAALKRVLRCDAPSVCGLYHKPTAPSESHLHLKLGSLLARPKHTRANNADRYSVE